MCGVGWVAHKILESAQGPLVLGFWVFGFGALCIFQGHTPTPYLLIKVYMTRLEAFPWVPIPSMWFIYNIDFDS